MSFGGDATVAYLSDLWKDSQALCNEWYDIIAYCFSSLVADSSDKVVSFRDDLCALVMV